MKRIAFAAALCCGATGALAGGEAVPAAPGPSPSVSPSDGRVFVVLGTGPGVVPDMAAALSRYYD